MRIIIASAAVILLAGCAARADSPAAQAASAERDGKYETDLAKALEGRTAGEPVTCINQRDIRSVKGVGDRTLIYEMNSRLLYRNDPPGGCRLRPSETIITRTSTNQLCRGDIARIADLTTGVETDGCGLGDFVPYRN